MRDILTIQEQRNRSPLLSRAQAVTEMARLEHEKARLLRELKTWLDNEARTNKRLQQVEQKLATVQAFLFPEIVGETPGSEGHRMPNGQGDIDDQQPRNWKEVRLEY